MTPDLRTSSGFVPKFSGFQRTRSASVPTATWPTRWLMPCVMALSEADSSATKQEEENATTHGLMVYLEIYRLTRLLSHPPAASPSDASGPRNSRILLAVRHVRLMTSPTRPIACESELIIAIAPSSCSTSSAATVSARMRDSANATSSGMFLSRWWHTMSI